MFCWWTSKGTYLNIDSFSKNGLQHGQFLLLFMIRNFRAWVLLIISFIKLFHYNSFIIIIMIVVVSFFGFSCCSFLSDTAFSNLLEHSDLVLSFSQYIFIYGHLVEMLCGVNRVRRPIHVNITRQMLLNRSLLLQRTGTFFDLGRALVILWSGDDLDGMGWLLEVAPDALNLLVQTTATVTKGYRILHVVGLDVASKLWLLGVATHGAEELRLLSWSFSIVRFVAYFFHTRGVEVHLFLLVW